jgi:hypothetical protein
MTEFSEERLGELIAALRPAPPAWVAAAIELPYARAAIDELTARATTDRGVRDVMLADLEQTLRSAGVEPRPSLVESLRSRLGGLDW